MRTFILVLVLGMAVSAFSQTAAHQFITGPSQITSKSKLDIQPLSVEKLSLEILSLVILWMSVFVFCYGRESFIRARFPLLFLLLLVPIPEFAIDKTIFALQAGSSDVAYGLLRIFNVPVLKEGFIHRLQFYTSQDITDSSEWCRSQILPAFAVAYGLSHR